MMLSLKKAAAKTTEQFSLPTMTDTNSRGLSASGNQGRHFALAALDMSRGVPEVLTSSNEEDVELDSMSTSQNWTRDDEGIMLAS